MMALRTSRCQSTSTRNDRPLMAPITMDAGDRDIEGGIANGVAKEVWQGKVCPGGDGTVGDDDASVDEFRMMTALLSAERR